MLHANTQGIQLSNQLNPQTLTTDFISEALTLSELFNLNEIAAVDLLLSGAQIIIIVILHLSLGSSLIVVLNMWSFHFYWIFVYFFKFNWLIWYTKFHNNWIVYSNLDSMRETAENQLTYFPDLPRGLVAVLLYYDGKASLVNCLKLLLQVRDGRTWLIPDLAVCLREVISKFTGQVIQQGLVAKVLGEFLCILVLFYSFS